MAKHVVAEAAALPEGGRLLVTVSGREIGVFRVGGRYYAVRNRCAHQGGPLCEGEILGRLRSRRPGEHDYDAGSPLLECPWHGWEYDLETGASWFDPRSVRVRPYPVGVEAGSEILADPETGLVRGPYVVETFPVSREGAYLVVEVSG